MAIGTTALALGASAVGGIAQASAASKAAKEQGKAADQQIALQREIYEDQTERFSPFLGAGTNALRAYAFEMGLGDRPMVGGTLPEITEISGQQTQTPHGYDEMGQQVYRTTTGATRYGVGGQTFDTRAAAEAWANDNRTGATPYAGFQASPGYNFAVQQGQQGVEASAAARGGLRSGRTMQDLTRYRLGMANQEYGNWLSRLAGMTDMGMGAAGMQASAGNAFASGASTALANKGDAQAAGAIGVGNAINSGIGNALGSWSYMQNLNRSAPAQGNSPWWLGGAAR